MVKITLAITATGSGHTRDLIVCSPARRLRARERIVHWLYSCLHRPAHGHASSLGLPPGNLFASVLSVAAFQRSRYDAVLRSWFRLVSMNDEHTAAVVQRYLDELAGGEPSDSTVRALLDQSVQRLHKLCAALLYRSYPRLTRPPLNLQVEEMLSAVVERLIKALREIHPRTVREFFALASQHMWWELNEMARRLVLLFNFYGSSGFSVGAPFEVEG